MKTHKVIFAAFAAIVLGAFVLTGCSNEEEISKSQISNSFLQKEAIDLTKDTDFVELYNLISDYAKTEKDVEQINYYISKMETNGDLSNEDMELFAKSMGYSNREAAAEYTAKFYVLYEKLDERYGLYEYDQPELGEFFMDGFLDFEITPSNQCERRFNNCSSQADRSEERRVGKECTAIRHTIFSRDWSSDVCSSDLFK